jgi:sugar/nucleoside kinase (ribokinase family)
MHIARVDSHLNDLCAFRHMCIPRGSLQVRGAAASMAPTFLEQPEVARVLQTARVLYATSFVLSTPQRAQCANLMAAEAERRRGGAAFALNLSSAGMLPRVLPQVLALLPRTNYLFGNSDELRALGQLLGWNDGTATDDDASRAYSLAKLLAPGGVAVITRGTEATLIASSSSSANAWTVPVPTVSHNGAKNGC